MIFMASTSNLFAITLTMGATCCFAQRPTDVPGWQAARWGMSEPEVVKAFNGAAKQIGFPLNRRSYGDGVANYGVPDLVIEGLPFHSEFVVDRNGFLVRVAIKAAGNPSQGDFLALEKGLNAKYGPPDFVAADGITKIRRWLFPTTIIELSFLDAQSSLGLRVLGVFYSANMTKRSPL